jgi:two-component system response regulator (stage 0 sporulation protein F)
MERSKVKILVVDDEKDIVHFTAKILQYDGFQVLTSVEGLHAWEVFQKERPHICLLDVRLAYSKIDGMELLRRIKAVDKNVECIMITRIKEQETVDKAKALGVKYYYFKPVATEVWLPSVCAAADAIPESGASG